MKKIAILVADFYDDLEFHYPRIRLIEEGYQVDIIGDIKGHAYKSKHGMMVTAEFAASEVDASSYDALMIPGGFAPDYMRRSASILAFASAFAKLNRPTGAICHGAWLMCSTFDLKGRHMTCFHSIKDDIIHAGAMYHDEAVVVDKNFITSRTPLDLPVFMKAFITAII